MKALQLVQQTIIGDELALAWSDGVESYIKLQKLRENCPCASCQGEPDAMGRVIKPQVLHTLRGFQAIRMSQLGGYALQMTWADGHSSGIYAFELLRKLG